MVMAKMRDRVSWHIAKIIEIRIAFEGANQSPDIQQITTNAMHDVEMAPSEENKVENAEEPPQPVKKPQNPNQKYEYYINYLGHQRRNDRWITDDEFRIEEEEIEREFKAYEDKVREEKELNEFLYNDEHLGLNEKQIHEFEESTKVKSVEFVEMGLNRTEAWYFSPFPKEYHCKTLYICEFCLHFFVHKNELIRHSERCKVRCPPGDEIYRDDSVAMFEIDGKNQ